ncbi:MAG: hypothetical protein KF883_13175 [Thermomicrobiales bacterium]|nr:hypothetical protein [Thermomicrobiales bacterium]
MAGLEPDVHDAVAAHCDSCSHCREVIDELTTTVSMLAFASRPVAPPATAKAALFARIAQNAVPAERPALWTGDSLDSFRTPTLPAAPIIPAQPIAPGSGLEAAPNRSWSRFVSYAAPLATIPLILALGFVGYWGTSNRIQLNNRTEAVDQLNSTVELLNSRIDSLSVGMGDFERYLNPDTSKHYAMLDPSPSTGGSQAYGLLLTYAFGDEAVVMTWRLDPEIDAYEVVISGVDGSEKSLGNLYPDADGDAMLRVDFGIPLNEIQSIHVRPKAELYGTASDLRAQQPDALTAILWPGLSGVQDTVTLQSYP